jgi:hypothetical protein
MSQSETTPPAFFKAPTINPTPEVFKAVLVYQRAKEAFNAADAAFKRTKAGYLREADMPARAAAQGKFYLDGHAAWKTIHDWHDEVTTLHSTVYFHSMVGAFLSFANDHLEARDTGFVKAVNAHIAANGQHVSALFGLPCTPDWVDVAFGSRRYKAALRIGREGIEAVDFYEVKDDNRVSGFHDVSARMKYRCYEERLRHPLVKVTNDEMPPSAAVDYADLIKEAATLASALTDFNNSVMSDYNLYQHRLDMVSDALTIRIGYFEEPVNPDAE